MQTEYYRLYVEELHNKLLQIKQFVRAHNLTIGQFAEDLLRDSLEKLLPKKVSISQGFIVDRQLCSHQCDVLIYDSYNFAPLFKTNSLVVLPAKSVLAVIEVKTSIGKRQFLKTLEDFSLLHKLGISNKYLFIYNACSVRTLKTYFFLNENSNKSNEVEQNGVCFGVGFDQDDFEELPDVIIGLKPQKEFILRKNYIITGSRDMMGYESLIFNDKKNRPISCLQEFVEIILSKLGDASMNVDEIGESFNRYDAIPLFDM
ncbi:hypothetical protein Bacsa_1700 [Phocaeicola salanitronis DSM 18170]|uniref:DUF6602 domain-containing protein n=1 Tax=Phocaeicola salanitronis (strain DSM 18170 / JCM 13657 / CCUG 60908 / BL78) TaxID=667015 RepID=F0R0Q9_PHOSB|nr:DUF6602 domain-containing protein [Phocaeicola salanitronis]ADY36263.1 hypothetical protein Bacsa_1700 [Phocaeicola salanitronis DSM 18170]